MGTIAEEKQKMLDSLDSLVFGSILARIDVVGALIFAEEMAVQAAVGISNPAYYQICLFYAKQKALLKGLTSGDFLSFDLALDGGVTWEDTHLFTLPTAQTFGYLCVDVDTNVPVEIVNPQDYYLTKDLTGNLVSIEKDPVSISTPTPIVGLIEPFTASDGVITEYQKTLSVPIIKGTLKLLHDGVPVATDDGLGVIAGTGITGTVDYVTREVTISYTAPPVADVEISFQLDTYINKAKWLTAYQEATFTTSSVQYGPGNSLTLNKITLDTPANVAPTLMHTQLVRNRHTHQVLGKLIVVCEGLEITDGWDKATGSYDSMMELSDTDFKGFFGFSNPDLTNDLTTSANPNIRSSAEKVGASYPYIERNPMYPATDGTYADDTPYKGMFVHWEEDINQVLQPRWRVLSGLKWIMETSPTGTLSDTTPRNPNLVALAVLAAKNMSAMGAGLADAMTQPPPSTPQASASYYSYEVSGTTGLVEQIGHYYDPVGDPLATPDPIPPGFNDPPVNNGPWNWLSEAGYSNPPDLGKTTCVYNIVEQIKSVQTGNLDDVQTAVTGIIGLGNVTNTTPEGTPDDVAKDNAFFLATQAYDTALETMFGASGYHTNIGDPTTYNYDMGPSSVLVTFQASSDTYNTELTTRIADLNSFLGVVADASSVTLGKYTQIVYSAASMTVHRSIGFIRKVLKEYDTLLGIKTVLEKKQADYALLP